MTRLIITTLLFVGHFSYGQSIDTISKIVFLYSKGHNSWGHPGVYGTSEYIDFCPSSDGNFKLTRFYKVSYSAGTDGKTFQKDTTELAITKHSKVDRKNIQTWLTELNTNKENYNAAFVKSWLTKPTKKEIISIAKSNRKSLFFDKDFKEEKRDVIKKIQNFYQLDSFLIQSKPNPEYSMMVTDTWHNLRIEVIRNTDTTIYQSQFFFDPFGQPISCYLHKDYSKEKNIINLQANTSAQIFLPKESLTYKNLDLNNIKNKFIKDWIDKDF